MDNLEDVIRRRRSISCSPTRSRSPEGWRLHQQAIDDLETSDKGLFDAVHVRRLLLPAETTSAAEATSARARPSPSPECIRRGPLST